MWAPGCHVENTIVRYGRTLQPLLVAGNIDVQFLEENVAAVWADSAAAREEVGDQPPAVRKALALGRFLLEPLPVLASLCGELLDGFTSRAKPVVGLTSDSASRTGPLPVLASLCGTLCGELCWCMARLRAALQLCFTFRAKATQI